MMVLIKIGLQVKFAKQRYSAIYPNGTLFGLENNGFSCAHFVKSTKI